MTRARTGLETDPTKIDRVKFWRDVQALERIQAASSTAEAQEQIVQHLFRYSGVEVGAAEVDVAAEYNRFRSRITAATHDLTEYTNTMLPDDLLQRTSLTSEIAGATDPDQLVDMLLTVKDQRTRFEVRRLLHFGALFYEYEKHFGREADRQEFLHQLELYLDATMFTDDGAIDADLYHQIKDGTTGLVQAASIRLPQFDDSASRRQTGENHVKLSFRTLQGDLPIHVVMEERLKDPFSAALKAIRTRRSLSELQDIYGFALYVNQSREGRELHTVVDALEQRFAVDPLERDIHPLRQAAVGELTRSNPNLARSGKFMVEKFFANWDPAILVQQREAIEPTLNKFYRAQRNRDRFWQYVQQFQGRTTSVEFQVGTLRDYLNAKLAGGDENHRVYKHRQASGEMRDDARNVLELLYPEKLYGINFRDPAIIEVMRRKQLAGIGLHSAVLAQLDANA